MVIVELTDARENHVHYFQRKWNATSEMRFCIRLKRTILKKMRRLFNLELFLCAMRLKLLTNSSMSIYRTMKTLSRVIQTIRTPTVQLC
ncbi:hypothetical protein P8452_20127 [Trifolium repens]|nr:hypothetical protein P8452_20127 [Trifolium repens]